MTSLWLDRPRDVTADPLPTDRLDVLVVGGGLTGLTTALLFARAGRRTALVDAGDIGGLTTGHTTGKVTLLQGTKLMRLSRTHGRDVLAAYVEANREGQEWLHRFCDEHGVPVQVRVDATYADRKDDVAAVRNVHDIAYDLGLPVRWAERLDLPFPVYGAAALSGQLQIDAIEVAEALQEQLRAHGGTVHPHRRVVSVEVPSDENGDVRVELEDGQPLAAGHVVLATGTPAPDRGLSFALEAQRSYILALDGITPPVGMFINAGSPTRSLRDVHRDGRDLVLVGGSGHAVGRTASEQSHLDDLRAFAAQWFPEARETHAWSAQDYTPVGGLPVVGHLPGSSGRVHVATGYEKWGMANSVAAALRIVGETLGQRPTWAEPLARQPLDPRNVPGLVGNGLRIAFAEGTALARAMGCLPGSRNGVHACTHMGGTLHWNDAERTWDCPLHGSRFAEDGTVLEGPARRPLSVRRTA